jgi:CRISPR-associated endoribonuclease Cas6
MESLPNHFRFARFLFFLKALTHIRLPAYKGSTLRGGFGHAFKKVVCVKREKTCTSCLLKGKCVYSYVFETPPPQDTSKMRKYPFAPHPFIITPPLEERRDYEEGESFSFELTLIGRSIEYLPYFIYTFEELGKMGIGKALGKYELSEVRANGKQGNAEIIYSAREKILKNSYAVQKAEDLNHFLHSPSALKLNFLTPTRLKYEGSLAPRLEFHILFRNLLRRISLLSYFHCDEELNVDFKGLIERATDVGTHQEHLSWFDWERYSNRQETKMKMGGFVGSAWFEGNLEPFLPFLLLGEQIHVGKGTTFGLGKYRISHEES